MSVGTSKAQVTEQHSAEPPIYDSALLTNPGIAEVKELFRYRDLLWQLVSRNIKTRYKRSVLGILWTMLNPLLMMLVLTFVFSNVFRFQLPHYATYALAGLALWNFFAQTTAGAMSELIWGGSLMHRIYIPRSIFAVSALGTSLVNLVLTLIPLFIVMLITGTPIRPALMILPLPILLTAMFALGVALTLSRVAAYFADVLEMYQILLMAWMYLTPIIYPKEILPENMRWLFNLNPMYHLTEIFRAPLLIGWLAGPKLCWLRLLPQLSRWHLVGGIFQGRPMSLRTGSDNLAESGNLTLDDDLDLTWLPKEDAAEVIIRLEGVSVVYRAPSERINTFKEYAIRLAKRQLAHQEFCALNDVSLEVKRGEVFGLVGHNGAGKSTLLKIVSRVMKPTRGRAWVKGKIAPLLELGAGFHTELSGRENVFLNGTLLGYSRVEMKELFDSIVEFSELQDFIDAPLRTYSTGMTVRLGFAVATATRPDVLIVDEVLAVGDEQFQEKCTERIMDFRRKGTSILLVTHSSKTVERICDRAAWLDHGKLRAVGLPDSIIEQYHARYHRQSAADKEAASSNSRKQGSTVSSASSAKPAISEEVLTLEEQAMKKDWFYQFELPSGKITNSFMLEASRRIHKDRLAMIDSVLDESFAGDVSQLSCLDIGCNQGYFSVEMARRGFQKVVGFDARRPNVEDANLMRQIYGLTNLRFRIADVSKVSTGELGQFDVVMMLSVLFWLENPIGALRLMKALTTKMLIIETPVAPDLSGEMEWGSRKFRKPLQGSFALLEQTAESKSPIGSLTELSLCPGHETLIWMLQKLGFTNIRTVPVPADAHEQLASGNRVMIVAQV